MQALAMLSRSITASERAEDFAKRIKKNIQKNTLDVLEEKIEKLGDIIFETKDFSLNTDLNKGQQALTMSECQARFEKIIELEFEKKLLERELRIKQTSFDNYFDPEE